MEKLSQKQIQILEYMKKEVKENIIVTDKTSKTNVVTQ